jgi:hypothetical protein
MKVSLDSRFLNILEKLALNPYNCEDLKYLFVYLIHQHAYLCHNTINLQVHSTTESPILWL